MAYHSHSLIDSIFRLQFHLLSAGMARNTLKQALSAWWQVQVPGLRDESARAAGFLPAMRIECMEQGWPGLDDAVLSGLFA